MNTTLSLALGTVAGAALGAFFFAGLRWTIGHGLASRSPALWFLLSLLLRTGVVVAALYALGRDDWRRLLACLVGFWVARGIVMRFAWRPIRTVMSS